MAGYEVRLHRSSLSRTTHHSDDRPLSETAPTQGTLRVFPDVQLSNAYAILRPFFRPTVPKDSPDILDPENWKFGKLVFCCCS